jgi:hypothetical protein
VHILTILSRSWGLRKAGKEFGVSIYMIRCAKQLVKAKGVLCTPNCKPVKMLKDDTVKPFVNLPGKRDFASVKEHGKGLHRER